MYNHAYVIWQIAYELWNFIRTKDAFAQARLALLMHEIQCVKPTVVKKPGLQDV
jgi:hypothetical protein